jgi:hypothetical protein
MLTSSAKIVRIEEGHQQPRLSPAQKRFNALIKKIDKQKQCLAVWQETIPRYQQRVAEQLLPLRQTFSEHQVEMVHLLDRQHRDKRLTRSQKKKLAHFIQELCHELINEHEREDLKPIYNKYSESDFDVDEQDANALAGDFIRSVLEHELGIELDEEEFDVTTPEKTAEFIRARLEERERHAEERRRRRKKTAKQRAREVRQQAEETKLGKSLQAVYRQLVTALHPDREMDPRERERKTGLMQQVTVAYGKKDLLQLLELQLTIEQIDQSSINTIAADRLKYYNKILQEQLEQVQREVAEIELAVKQQAGIAPYATLSPGRLMRLVQEDIGRLRDEIEGIREDLDALQDVRRLKAWLKDYRIPSETEELMAALSAGEDLPPFLFR